MARKTSRDHGRNRNPSVVPVLQPSQALAEELSARRSGRHRRVAYTSLVQLLEESFRKFGCARRSGLHGCAIQLSRHRRDVGCARCLAAEQGLGQGRAGGDHDAERAAVYGGDGGVLRAGYTVVNVNPLYTPRELEHQLKDSGAEAIFILENFATTLEQVIDRKRAATSSWRDGRHAGFRKSLIVNFVVRHVKKMVPAFACRCRGRSVPLQHGAGRRHADEL